MPPTTKPCKHGMAPGECEQCTPATRNGENLVIPFAQLNRNERKAALRELVEEVGRDKTPAEILAIAADHGMTGRGVTVARISALRSDMGFPSMRGRRSGPGTDDRNGGGRLVPAKAGMKPARRQKDAVQHEPEDESPLVSVAELAEFVRLVKSITPGVARHLLEIVS